MATPDEHSTGDVAQREFVTSRLFSCSREALFRACTDPAILATWWGPNGFTNTFHQFDLRHGGIWRFTMHGPDGTRYENACEFLEIVPPERLVILHLEPVHRFRLTMTFDEAGTFEEAGNASADAGQTRLSWHMIFDSAAEADRVRPYIPAANEQNFDRLAAAIA